MVKKLRIAVITSWFPKDQADFSGIFIREQVEVLGERFQIDVVHPEIDYSVFRPFFSKRISEFEIKGIPVIRIQVRQSFPIFNQWNFLVATKHYIVNRLKDQKIDLIHCHVSYPAGVLGMLVANRLGVPFVITEHYGDFVGLFRTPIHKYLILRAMSKAAGISTVSQYSRRIIQRFTNTPITVVPNVIDVSKFSLIKNKKPEKREIMAGFLGGLDTDVKGLDILLRAVAELPRLPLVIKIGGDGKLLGHYKGLARQLGLAEKCIFMGKIPVDRRFEFFNSLDFFILSSRHESFGVVLLEAMASGLPVVATRCGGPEEIVDKENGILVEKENPPALAKGLQIMIKQYALFDPLKIRTRVARYFGKEAFLTRMEKFYLGVLQGREKNG